MSAQVLFFSYIAAAGAAILLLLALGSLRWYWHVISALLGLTFGLIPPPAGMEGNNHFYLVTGVGCAFFLLWGIAAPLFRRKRST